MPEIRDLLFDPTLDLDPPPNREPAPIDPLDPHTIPGWCFRTCCPDVKLEHTDWDMENFYKGLGIT